MKQIASIAYMVSAFPVLSETFILNEILEIRNHGLKVSIFSIKKTKDKIFHNSAQELLKDTFYCPYLFSNALWRAQLYFLKRNPRQYISTLLLVIIGMRKSFSFLLKSLILFPKVIFYARMVIDSEIRHVHAHWATHPTTAALIISRLTGASYSLTAHAHDIQVNTTMLCQKAKKALFVITISHYNKRYLLRKCPELVEDKVYVVRTGTDPEKFKPLTKPTVLKSEFVILSVGRLTEMKGFPFLIEACRIISQKDIGLQCWIVGTGPEKKRLKNLTKRHKLEKIIQFMGPLPHNKLISLFAKADAFVLSSIITSYGQKEGIAVSLMEAMAMELPVVTTDISGTPELVEHMKTGLLVPQKDESALAEAIEKLIADPELRKQLGKNGRQKVIAEFNTAKNVKKLANLFRQAIAISRR